MRAALLSIGDRVEPGQYELHSRFNHACNFTLGERLVCVVDETVGAGPLNVVLSGFRDFSPFPLLYISCDSVMTGGLCLSFGEGQRYWSALHVANPHSGRLRRNLVFFGKYLAQAAPAASLAFLIDEARAAQVTSGFARALASHMARCAHKLYHGDLFDGIAGLKGCGPGLTPSGDDFLAGLVTGLHVVQRIWPRDLGNLPNAIFAAAIGGNLFSNNFLDLARRGLVSEDVQALVAALVAGETDAVAAAARKLLAVGSTSGADFATGFYMTMRDQSEFVARYDKQSCLARVFSPRHSRNLEERAWS